MTGALTRAADRPFLGVLLMLAFCALAPVGDAMAKLLGARMALGQLIAVRFAIQAAVLRRRWRWRSARRCA